MIYLLYAYLAVGLVCSGLTLFMMIGLPFKTQRNPNWIEMLNHFRKDKDFLWCLGLAFGVIVMWPYVLVCIMRSR